MTIQKQIYNRLTAAAEGDNIVEILTNALEYAFKAKAKIKSKGRETTIECKNSKYQAACWIEKNSGLSIVLQGGTHGRTDEHGDEYGTWQLTEGMYDVRADTLDKALKELKLRVKEFIADFSNQIPGARDKNVVKYMKDTQTILKRFLQKL